MRAATILAVFINAIPSIFERGTFLVLFVLMPLACIQRTRRIAGLGFMTLAPILSVLLWVSCAVSVYDYWGLRGLIIATLVAGVGVIPAAFMAELLDGTWIELFGLAVMTAVTLGSALGAVVIDRSATGRPTFPRPTPKRAALRGLPTMLIDDPNPYATPAELEEYIRDLDGLPDCDEVRYMRARAEKSLAQQIGRSANQPIPLTNRQ